MTSTSMKDAENWPLDLAAWWSLVTLISCFGGMDWRVNGKCLSLFRLLQQNTMCISFSVHFLYTQNVNSMRTGARSEFLPFMSLVPRWGPCTK